MQEQEHRFAANRRSADKKSLSSVDAESMEIKLEIYKTLFEATSDAMMIADESTRILYVNPAFTNITGYTEQDVLGKTPRILSSGKQDIHFYRRMWQSITTNKRWQGEIWNKKKSGDIFPAWQTINVIGEEGKPAHYISVFSDISQIKKSQADLWTLAHYDSLTGLANRSLLEERIKQELATTIRFKIYGALFFLDLDNFKTINDSLGHKVGDLLLRQVADRLRRDLREEDMIARLGGDEFVIVLSNLSYDKTIASNQLKVVAEKILDLLLIPYLLEGHELRVSVSIGITLFPNNGDTFDHLLRQADTAMYAAKNSGKNTYCFFHPDMQDKVNQRLQLEKELRNALVHDHLGLVYQPQFNYRQQLLGYEALVRWHHPEHGIISPQDFIPLAEETGLIAEIGRKVLTQACEQWVAWRRAGKNIPHISVNISPKQFSAPGFVDLVNGIVGSSGVDPRHIILEITEGLIVQNVKGIIEKMHALKQLGLRFSIDDFGTGYSSLSYLTRLPIDQLKIDKTFVVNLGINDNDAVIVETIIGMSKHLKLDLIAEGVETWQQLEHLYRCGCDGFQGYYFSKPLNREDI